MCNVDAREFFLVCKFEAFTAVMFQVYILCVVTSYSVVVGHQRFRGPRCLHLLCGEDEGSIDLWNVFILSQHYTTSQCRRPRLDYFSLLLDRITTASYQREVSFFRKFIRLFPFGVLCTKWK